MCSTGTPENTENDHEINCIPDLDSVTKLKYDNIYRNIVLNALGNIIIVDNLVNANRISKMIHYTYKNIITICFI